VSTPQHISRIPAAVWRLRGMSWHEKLRSLAATKCQDGIALVTSNDIARSTRCARTITPFCKGKSQTSTPQSGIETCWSHLKYPCPIHLLIWFSSLKLRSPLPETSQLSIMFSFQYLLLFAGVVVGAFKTPHERAAKYARKQTPRLRTRDVPGVATTSLFLNNKTAS